MIESLLESVFEKVNRQKVKCTVHSPNRQKFGEIAGDAEYKISLVFFLSFFIFVFVFFLSYIFYMSK